MNRTSKKPGRRGYGHRLILSTQAFFFSTEAGFSAYTIRLVAALIGLGVLFGGSITPPSKSDPGREIASGSRRTEFSILDFDRGSF